jgi:hypothetical protein
MVKMNISLLVWGFIGFIIGFVTGILLLYAKVRSLLKRIEAMKEQSIYDTVYTDPE